MCVISANGCTASLCVIAHTEIIIKHSQIFPGKAVLSFIFLQAFAFLPGSACIHGVIYLGIIMNFSLKLKHFQLEWSPLCLNSCHLEWIAVRLPPFTSFLWQSDCFSLCLNTSSKQLELTNINRLNQAYITSLHTDFGGPCFKNWRRKSQKGLVSEEIPQQLNHRRPTNALFKLKFAMWTLWGAILKAIQHHHFTDATWLIAELKLCDLTVVLPKCHLIQLVAPVVHHKKLNLFCTHKTLTKDVS